MKENIEPPITFQSASNLNWLAYFAENPIHILVRFSRNFHDNTGIKWPKSLMLYISRLLYFSRLWAHYLQTFIPAFLLRFVLIFVELSDDLNLKISSWDKSWNLPSILLYKFRQSIFYAFMIWVFFQSVIFHKTHKGKLGRTETD